MHNFTVPYLEKKTPFLLNCHRLEEILHLLLLLALLLLLLLLVLPHLLLLQEVRIAARLDLLLHLGDELLRLAPLLVLQPERFVLDGLLLLLQFRFFAGPGGGWLFGRHFCSFKG